MVLVQLNRVGVCEEVIAARCGGRPVGVRAPKQAMHSILQRAAKSLSRQRFGYFPSLRTAQSSSQAQATAAAAAPSPFSILGAATSWLKADRKQHRSRQEPVMSRAMLSCQVRKHSRSTGLGMQPGMLTSSRSAGGCSSSCWSAR